MYLSRWWWRRWCNSLSNPAFGNHCDALHDAFQRSWKDPQVICLHILTGEAAPEREKDHKQDHSFFIAWPISKLKIFQKNPRSNYIFAALCQDLSKLVSLSTEASIHSNAKGYALKHQRQDPRMILNSNSQLLLMRWSGQHVNFLQTIGITCQVHESSQIFLPNILG